MKFGIISIFPEMFNSFLDFGIIGRAFKKSILEIKFYNPRDFTEDTYQRIDDRPFGGGAGMVMMYEPIAKAIQKALLDFGENTKIIYLSPRGKIFNQKKAISLLDENKNIIFLCGRYEGIDNRIIDNFVDEEISLGDFVISGGEIPTMVIIDTISRMIPQVLNKESSFKDESFFNNFLDYEHYTRPFNIKTIETIRKIDNIRKVNKVPKVLLSGNHKEIETFRMKQKLGLTYKYRPDLLSSLCLTKEQESLLKEYKKENSVDKPNIGEKNAK